MRFSRVAVAVVPCLACGFLASCSSSSPSKGKALTTTSSIPTSSSTASGPTSSTPGTVPSTTSTAVPLCTVENLNGSFTVIPGSASAGHIEAKVVLTNSSKAVCRTYGYVGMKLLDASGTPVPTNVVRQPGSVATIILAPGQSVSAVTQFSADIAGQGDSTTGDCQPTAQSTEITPPNDTRFLVVQGPGRPVCERGTIDLRPLQAGA